MNLTDARGGDYFLDFHSGKIYIKTQSGGWVPMNWSTDAHMPHIDQIAKLELDAIADLLYQGQIREAAIQLGMFLYNVHVLREPHEDVKVENP